MDYGLVQCFKNSIEVMEGDSWKVKNAIWEEVYYQSTFG